MPLDQRKAGLLDRLSPDSQSALLGQELIRLGEAQEALDMAVHSLYETIQALLAAQKFFSRTAILQAAHAATRVRLLLETDVGEGKKAYPLSFFMVLSRGEAWTGGTGTELYLADSGDDLIYRFATVEAAQLTPGKYLTPDAGGVSLEAEFGLNLGGRLGKGIDILADGDFAAGSDLAVTVYGYLQ